MELFGPDGTLWARIPGEFPVWLVYSVGAGVFATLGQQAWRWWRDRRWTGWRLEIVLPDGGPRVSAMKLSADEVRAFQRSDFERLKWIRSAVTGYGMVSGVALADIEKTWFRRDHERRVFELDLRRAVTLGHVVLHPAPRQPEGVADARPDAADVEGSP